MNFKKAIEAKSINDLNNCLKTMIQSEKNEALYLSAENDFLEGVIALINVSTNINYQGEARRTALHIACLMDYEDIAIYLINSNANVNILDSLKRSPLHYVAGKGNTVIAQKLIQKQYEQTSAFKSVGNFINPLTHIWNLGNVLHPVDSFYGACYHYCREYINSKDILGHPPLYYAFESECKNPLKIQALLSDLGSTLDNKSSFIEQGANNALIQIITSLFTAGAYICINALLSGSSPKDPPTPIPSPQETINPPDPTPPNTQAFSAISKISPTNLCIAPRTLSMRFSATPYTVLPTVPGIISQAIPKITPRSNFCSGVSTSLSFENTLLTPISYGIIHTSLSDNINSDLMLSPLQEGFAISNHKRFGLIEFPTKINSNNSDDSVDSEKIDLHARFGLFKM